MGNIVSSKKKKKKTHTQRAVEMAKQVKNSYPENLTTCVESSEPKVRENQLSNLVF